MQMKGASELNNCLDMAVKLFVNLHIKMVNLRQLQSNY